MALSSTPVYTQRVQAKSFRFDNSDGVSPFKQVFEAGAEGALVRSINIHVDGGSPLPFWVLFNGGSCVIGKVNESAIGQSINLFDYMEGLPRDPFGNKYLPLEPAQKLYVKIPSVAVAAGVAVSGVIFADNF